MVYLFWLGLIACLHSYILYPLSLPLLSWFFIPQKKSKRTNHTPRVSLLISVYNEEDVLADKIANCLELDYPKDKLEILFGSDGSTDKTDSILQTLTNQPGFRVFKYSGRGGKAATLNKLYHEAQGDILVFCDANTMLLKNALQKLVQHFAQPKVGGVSGRLILNDSTGSGLSHGESIYWRIESAIKNLEGKMGVLVGANGGLYAIRKDLYRDIPQTKTVMDDFYITTDILRKGYGVYYEPLAIGTEETSVDSLGEFNRKIRIGEANFNFLSHYLLLLNPLRVLVAYSFFSHKFLRWVGPLLFLSLWVLNLGLLQNPQSHWIYTVFFVLQNSLYGLSAIGFWLNSAQKKSSLLFDVPYYFISMNIALFLGLVKSIFGAKKGSWDRVARHPAK